MSPFYRPDPADDLLGMSVANGGSVDRGDQAHASRMSAGDRRSPAEVSRLASKHVEQLNCTSLIDEGRAHQAWMAYYAALWSHTAYGYESAIDHLRKSIAMIDDTPLVERLLEDQLREASPEFRVEYQKRVASCFQLAADADAAEWPNMPDGAVVAPATNENSQTRFSRKLNGRGYRAAAMSIACLLMAIGFYCFGYRTSPMPDRGSLTAHLFTGDAPGVGHERTERDKPSEGPAIVNRPQEDHHTAPPPPQEIELVPNKQVLPEMVVQKATEGESPPLPKAPKKPISATQLTVEHFNSFGNALFSTKPRGQAKEPAQNDGLFKNISSIFTTSRTAESDSMTEQQHAEALESAESMFGPTSLNAAKALGLFADFYTKQRRFQTAAPLCERRLAILESTLSTDGAEFRECTLQWAKINLETKRGRLVSEALESSLAAFEEELGPDHLDTIACQEYLAMAYLQQSEFAKADELFRKALKSRETSVDESHPAIAAAWDHIGTANLGMGNIAMARQCFERGYRIRRKVLSADDPAFALSCNGLGLVFVAEQRYDLANGYFAHGKDIVERELGRTDVLTAAAYDNLAKIQFIRGNYRDASESFLQVHLMYQNIYGPTAAETVAAEQLLLESTTLAADAEQDKVIQQ